MPGSRTSKVGHYGFDFFLVRRVQIEGVRGWGAKEVGVMGVGARDLCGEGGADL